MVVIVGWKRRRAGEVEEARCMYVQRYKAATRDMCQFCCGGRKNNDVRVAEFRLEEIRLEEFRR